MATYYCWSGGSNTAPYDTWAKARNTFALAISSANADGDVILVADDHTEELSAATTYTFLNNVAVICVNRASGNVSEMGSSAWIGNSTANRLITLAGAFKVFMYGLTFRTAGSTAAAVTIANTDNSHFELDKVYFFTGNTSVNSHLQLGPSTTNANAYVKLKDCTVRFGNTAQSIAVRANIDITGLYIDSGGSEPSSVLINNSSSPGGSQAFVSGSDISHAGAGSIVGASTSIGIRVYITDSKLGASFTALASQTPSNKGAATVQLNNCSAGDEHYHFGYYDAFGEITCVESPYCNDGAKYDGTNPVSWRIITSSNASFYTPFVTPWIEKYHAGSSAITPFVEILNNASTAALQDNQVWAEFGYQGTSGSTQASFVSDSMALLGTPANQDAGVGLAGWTGESGTAWSGKLVSPSAITPAEIGTLKARICVGAASTTVFVDPTIRT